MAGDQDNPRPFDVRTVRYLVRLMSRNDLSEIDLSEGEKRIRIRRGPRVVQGTVAVAAPMSAHPPASAEQAPARPAVPAPAPAEASASKLIDIKSPTVGTFFGQRDPSSPPFVSVGSRVTPTTVVCLIEAMKVFNEITADCSGVIREVCINNKDFVEFNTVLFRVDPAG